MRENGNNWQSEVVPLDEEGTKNFSSDRVTSVSPTHEVTMAKGLIPAGSSAVCCVEKLPEAQ